MITITTQNTEKNYSVGVDQTIFTATYPCIVFARYSPNLNLFLRKRTPSSGTDSVSFLGTNNNNATILRFGNAVYLEVGDSIFASLIPSLTLYIIRLDQ